MVHVIETSKSLLGLKDSWRVICDILDLFNLYMNRGDIHKAEEALMQLVECCERHPESLLLGLGTIISDTQKILHMPQRLNRLNRLLVDNIYASFTN